MAPKYQNPENWNPVKNLILGNPKGFRTSGAASWAQDVAQPCQLTCSSIGSDHRTARTAPQATAQTLTFRDKIRSLKVCFGVGEVLLLLLAPSAAGSLDS